MPRVCERSLLVPGSATSAALRSEPVGRRYMLTRRPHNCGRILLTASLLAMPMGTNAAYNGAASMMNWNGEKVPFSVALRIGWNLPIDVVGAGVYGGIVKRDSTGKIIVGDEWPEDNRAPPAHNPVHTTGANTRFTPVHSRVKFLTTCCYAVYTQRSLTCPPPAPRHRSLPRLFQIHGEEPRIHAHRSPHHGRQHTQAEGPVRQP